MFGEGKQFKILSRIQTNDLHIHLERSNSLRYAVT